MVTRFSYFLTMPQEIWLAAQTRTCAPLHAAWLPRHDLSSALCVCVRVCGSVTPMSHSAQRLCFASFATKHPPFISVHCRYSLALAPYPPPSASPGALCIDNEGKPEFGIGTMKGWHTPSVKISIHGKWCYETRKKNVEWYKCHDRV